MANQKLTIFQKLTQVFGQNKGNLRHKQSPSFVFNKNELLKTSNVDDYQHSLLQAQQSHYISDQSAKVENNLYNQSVYYEPNRLAAYYDFENMEQTPEISAALDIFSEESCLVGDTIIPLTDGTFKTIQELYESKDKEFTVFGVNIDGDVVEPSTVEKVIYKGIKSVFVVTLDDDSEIICTDNHKWLDIENYWIETSELKPKTKLKTIIKTTDNLFNNSPYILDNEKNREVKSVVYLGKEKVYDLLNSAIDSSFGVKCNDGMIISHNCTVSEKGKILSIFSESNRVKQILEDLFENVLDINTNLQMWIRGVCKYGDNFVYLKVEPDKGITGCRQLPNIEIERVEGSLSKGINIINSSNELRFVWKNNNMEFQAWQMAHFRLLGDDRKLPYGTCLKYDTFIETKDGYKEIKDIIVGDMVWSFDDKTQTKQLSKVLDLVNSGKKTTFKVSTKNNFIDASKEHRIMIYDTESKSFIYKNTLDLKVGDFLVINPSKDDDVIKIIDKTKPIKNFNGYWKNIDLIPDHFTSELAQLYGYMIGDGWINNNAICIALSTHKSLNDKYINLLEKFSGKKVKFHGGENNISQGICNSKMLKTIFQRLDFHGHSFEKRLPKWVFSLPYETRKSLLNGIIDADGSLYIDKWNCLRYSIELSNEDLINDIKHLVQSLGYKSGKISSRNRKIHEIKNRKLLTTRKSFYFYFYETKIKQKKKYDIENRLTNEFIVEPITSIVSSGEHLTYDIYVENRNHNFYGNGIVVHNSMLEKVRSTWRRLLLSEDAMLIYRTSRAPERRVFKVFVGNMDDKDIEAYVQRTANKFKRDTVIDPRTGQADLRYNQMPVWKNSPIPLLDGRTITIEELAKEYDAGKENWVYSVQDKTSQIVPGKVVWCGKNYTANKMIKVWLDDDTWMMTAPEHPFVLRDGSHKPAKDLTAGDSLMPYYTKKSNKNDGMKIVDYDMIFNPNSGKYEFVHRLVANKILASEREDVRENTDFKINNNLTVHHIDFNKNNNNPENLQWIGNFDHIVLHKHIGRERLINYNKSEKKRQEFSQMGKEQSWDLRFKWYNGSELHKEHNKIRHDAQLKDWANPEKKIARSLNMRIMFDEYVFEQLRLNIISNVVTNRKTMMKFLSSEPMIDYIISINKNKRLNNLRKIDQCVLYRQVKERGFATVTDFINAHKLNHKVSRIEEIFEQDDVYCMTVVGPNDEDDRHNFALKSFNVDGTISVSGSFTANSVEQDFFIAVRDPNQSSPIETLPGACISLDSRIPMLDGRTLTLNEIILEWENGNRDMWVYSVDPKTGKSAPGMITWAGVTRKNTDVLKITLDNGKEIITTPDHKFVHRTNGFIEAQNLNVGDSLMPYYTREEKIKPTNKYGNNYHQIWDNEKQKWVFTHRMVTQFLKNSNLCNEIVYDLKYIDSDKKIVHHKDFNHYNNNPSNLYFMNGGDHMNYYQDTIWRNPEETKNKISKGLKNFSEWKYNVDKQNNLSKIFYNHKITKIELLNEKIDTGTITVDGDEIYHNYHTFALESGVYIKNSNLSDIADIEYIQKKLFAGLRVPKAFLGFEEIVGDGKSLALMDIRFARTINRIQKSAIQELNKIALIHLYFLGMEDELENFTLSLTNPSSQSELLKIEQWKEKITLYKDATSDQSQMGILPVSHTWAKKNILGMSDSEVILDLQQQRLERAMGFELSNTQFVIKRSRVFDNVDAKYGISEEERAKIEDANTQSQQMAGGEMTLPEPSGVPSPADGESPLSESIGNKTKRNIIKGMLGEADVDNINDLFDAEKAKRSIYEIEEKLKEILKD